MDSMVIDLVDELLDMDGDVTIAGSTFSRSYILKQLDPTAYREILLDTVNAHIEDLRDDLDRLDAVENFDEVEELKSRIEELSGI
jgi:polyhydroxyalkanoate synthesis regulator phasin